MKQDNGDMDDLFRRASDKYPLRTDSADWDRLAAALEKAPDSPSDPEAADERRRRSIFWWFLLLPLGGLGYYTWQATMHVHPATPSAITTTVAGASGAATRSVAGASSAATRSAAGASGAATATATDAPRSATTTAAGAAGAADGAGAAGAGVKGAAVANGSVAGAAGSASSGQAIAGSAAAGSTAAGLAAVTPGGVSGATRTGAGKHHRDATASAGRQRFSATGGATATGLDGNYQSGSEGAGATTATSAGVNQSGKARQLLYSHLDLRRVPTAGGYNLVVNVTAPPTPVDSSSSGKKKTTASVAKKSAHVYVGILGAPDLSTVKFQSTKGVGSTFGVLLGYSFNDRWAIESGVYLDRKRYYTGGEYFNKEGVRTYPNTNLLTVDGTCYMWEIPINLRYNFNTSPRMKWFATAGLSTYLMTKENYSYQYQYTWGGSVEDGAWNLKKPSQYWFSVVNISAGFEQRLGKIGNLRLEPYLRLPLSGIGTGRLPILSAGLNIGITRQLW